MTPRSPNADRDRRSRVLIDLNPREQRLYDRLRAQVLTPAPGERSGFRDMLFRLMRDPRVPVSSKAVAVLGAAYLLSPIDLMPAFLLGPIGLVDDLIVVATVLSRMLNRVHPDVVRSHWSGQGDALEAVQRVADWSERYFRDRMRQLAGWVGRPAR